MFVFSYFMWNDMALDIQHKGSNAPSIRIKNVWNQAIVQQVHEEQAVDNVVLSKTEPLRYGLVHLFPLLLCHWWLGDGNTAGW